MIVTLAASYWPCDRGGRAAQGVKRRLPMDECGRDSRAPWGDRPASWLGSHKKIIALVERSGRWLVPVVSMIIGVTIVAESFFG